MPDAAEDDRSRPSPFPQPRRRRPGGQPAATARRSPLIGTVVGLVAVVLIDGISRWSASAISVRPRAGSPLILPALLFFDDIRAWRGYGVRFLVALVAAAGRRRARPHRGVVGEPVAAAISGAVGAAVAALVYSPDLVSGRPWLTGQAR